jgi:hypothetical protein
MTSFDFPFIDDVTVEACYQRCITRRKNTAGLRALELERHGGQCHYCDKLFREVKIDTRFGQFSYFIPGCDCYKQCVVTEVYHHPEILIDGCGHWMVEERFRNLSHCLNCWGDPEEIKKKEQKALQGERKSKVKSQRKKIDGKSAASGERE